MHFLRSKFISKFQKFSIEFSSLLLTYLLTYLLTCVPTPRLPNLTQILKYISSPGSTTLILIEHSFIHFINTQSTKEPLTNLSRTLIGDLEFLDNEFDYLGIGRHRNHAFWCLQMKNKLDTWILAYILQK